MNLDGVQRTLDRLGAHYALIGAHAMAARGYPRFTIDIDLLTSDARVLEQTTWAELIETGATVDARRGDADGPLGGVVHIQHQPPLTPNRREAGRPHPAELLTYARDLA